MRGETSCLIAWRYAVYEKIMVPTDGAREASKAINHAEELAKKFDSEVILLRVVQPSSIPAATMGNPGGVAVYEVAFEAADAETQANIKKARNQLNSRRRQLEKEGITARAEVLIGDPAGIIKRVAEDEDVDLIVMATRGRSGIRRALLGSVADDIVRSNVAPVLLLKR